MIESLALDDLTQALAEGCEPDLHKRMSRVATQFERLFRIRPPTAPGACFIGAEARPSGALWTAPDRPKINLAGFGLAEDEAALKCVGEAVELLSQFEQPDDEAQSLDAPATWALGFDAMFETGPIGRAFPGRLLSTGQICAVPRGLCLRPKVGFAYGRPRFPLGLGSGAGPTLEHAVLHGLLELIERDAAALWWYAGRQGRRIAFDEPAALPGLLALAACRHGAAERDLVLVDISSAFGVPVVAALSSGPDARGFACGLSARLSYDEAIRSAVLEMLQMELAQNVTVTKAGQSGISSLNATDLNHLQKHLGPGARDLLPVASAAKGVRLPETTPMAGLPPHAALPELVARLVSAGIEAVAVDLTRPEFGIPAARVISPDLQPEPGTFASRRLSSAMAKSGIRFTMPLI